MNVSNPVPSEMYRSIGSTEAVVQRAHDLIPVLRERAAQCDAMRELPPETVADIRRTGVHRVFQPARFGGSESPLRAGVEVLTAIGRGCASTAWVVVQNMTHNLMIANWPDEAQQELWGAQPDALVSGILIPGIGRARRVPGGFVLSGRWPFVSGVNVCDWAMFTAFVENDQGVKEDVHFLIPRHQFEIIDTWHVVGLRGSSSNDVKVDEVFVPAHRTITVADLKGGHVSPGSRHNAATVFRAPCYAVFGIYIGAAGLGAAQATVQYYVDQTKRRGATMAGQSMAQYTTQQVKIAEATAAVETATLLLNTCADEAMAILESGRLPSDVERTRFRSMAAYAGKLATNAVNIVWDAGGGAMMYDTNPISRGFRDVICANRHTTQTWDNNAAQHGRSLLGLPLDNPAL